VNTPKCLLGIQIERCKDKLIIHQRSYIKRLLERFIAPEALPPLPRPWTLSNHSSKLPKWLLSRKTLWSTALQWESQCIVINTRPDLAFTYLLPSSVFRSPYPNRVKSTHSLEACLALFILHPEHGYDCTKAEENFFIAMLEGLKWSTNGDT
jgi:hypothetical protein